MTAEPLQSQRRGWIVGAALLVPLLITAVLSRVRDSVTPATAVLLLVLVVVAAGASGNRWAGMAAAISSAAWYDFFLTEPFNSFTIDDPDDIEVAVLLVVIGVAVSELALWGRRQQQRSSERAGYLDGITETVAALSSHDQPFAVVAGLVSDRIAEVLGASSCRFERGSELDRRDAVLSSDGDVTQHGRPIDVDRGGLPTDAYTLIPVRHGERLIGWFVVNSAERVVRPSRERRQVAFALAYHLATFSDGN